MSRLSLRKIFTGISRRISLIFIFLLSFFFRDSHFTLESDSTWLDFLNKAIDHNMDKLRSVLQELEGTNT